MILWENIAYLASDKKRAEAFAELKSTVGLRPADIRRARERTLLLITSKGIVAGHSADKLRAAAEIAKEFDDDLQSILQEPTPLAKKALRRFPAIGEPAAEKILLFNHRLPVLALESNGLRVLVRLGYSSEKKSYSATYKGIRQALATQPSTDCAALIRAHQLLRLHGQTLCKRNSPDCPKCPLRSECAFFQETGGTLMRK